MTSRPRTDLSPIVWLLLAVCAGWLVLLVAGAVLMQVAS